MNNKFGFAVATLLLLTASCEHKNENSDDLNYEEKGLIIKMSFACGWCGGADSLIITQDVTIYNYKDPCGDNDLSDKTNTKSEDWKELNELLNFDEFEAITVNSCDVCFDGCDTWISVKSDDYNHEIRFGHNDSVVIGTILPFIQKIGDIRSRFTEN